MTQSDYIYREKTAEANESETVLENVNTIFYVVLRYKRIIQTMTIIRST